MAVDRRAIVRLEPGDYEVRCIGLEGRTDTRLVDCETRDTLDVDGSSIREAASASLARGPESNGSRKPGAWAGVAASRKVAVRIGLRERDLQRRVTSAGGRWDRDRRVWFVVRGMAPSCTIRLIRKDLINIGLHYGRRWAKNLL